MQIWFLDTWVLSLHSLSFALPLTHVSYHSVHTSGSTLALQTSLHHHSPELNFQLHGIIWWLHIIAMSISRMQDKVTINSTVQLYQTCLGRQLLLLYSSEPSTIYTWWTSPTWPPSNYISFGPMEIKAISITVNQVVPTFAMQLGTLWETVSWVKTKF